MRPWREEKVTLSQIALRICSASPRYTVNVSDSDLKDIEHALATLTPREERTLRLRAKGLTQRATAEELRTWNRKQVAVTPQRIHQIEQKALRKLRHHSRGLDFQNWLIVKA